MIFRILVLALLIFWGVWVFQSCEYQGGENGNNVNVEEVTGGEEVDMDTDTEDEEVSEKDDDEDEDEMPDDEDSEDDSDEEDKEDMEDDEDEDEEEKTSLLEKMFGKKDDKEDDEDAVEVSKTDNGDTTLSTTTSGETTVKVAPVATAPMAPKVVKPVEPVRESYVRLYVYENRIDSFGQEAFTGRVHFEVINMTRFKQRVFLPECGRELGEVEPHQTTYMGFEPKDAGEYVVLANDVRGERSIIVDVMD